MNRIEQPEKLDEVRYMSSIIDDQAQRAEHEWNLSPWVADVIHSLGDGDPPISPTYVTDAAASLSTVTPPLDEEGALGVPDWDQVDQEYLEEWLDNHWREACSWIDAYERTLSVPEKEDLELYDELFRRAYVHMMQQARYRLWNFLAERADEWMYTVLLEMRRDGGPIKSAYVIQRREPVLQELWNRFSDYSKNDIRPVALLRGYCENLIGDGGID